MLVLDPLTDVVKIGVEEAVREDFWLTVVAEEADAVLVCGAVRDSGRVAGMDLVVVVLGVSW